MQLNNGLITLSSKGSCTHVGGNFQARFTKTLLCKHRFQTKTI